MRRARPLQSVVFSAGHSCAPRAFDASTPAIAPAPTQPLPGATSSPPSADTPCIHHEVAAPELVHFSGTRGELGGFLYKPKGNGPFPAVLFNHGSEQRPGNKYGQALFYVSHGFVLFVPHRLGHGRSPGDYIIDARDRAPAGARDATLVRLLEAQVEDVADATTFLKSLSFVDGQAVAMVGCSFGGIETLLAAERDLGLSAAVNFAGAAMTWAANAPLRDRMRKAARNAKAPVFFVQAANDYDTRPSVQLAGEMEKAGKAHLLKIYPAKGSTAKEGHGFCQAGMQPPWGDDVLAFLARNGIRATPASGSSHPVLDKCMI